MKILLWGDYSGVHQDLKSALLELGHNVIIASTGDGYRKFSNDIFIDVDQRNFLTRYRSLQKSFAQLLDYNLNDFDVFQAMNPAVNGAFSAFSTLQKIFKVIPIKTTLVAGDDYYVWQELPKDPRFERWQEGIPQPRLKDLGLSYFRAYHLFGIFNTWFANNMDAIIPTTRGLYQRSYRNFKQLHEAIPFPVNTNQHRYRSNTVDSKLVLFHGVTGRRPKGSDVIVKAMNSVKEKYPSDVELRIVEKMPFKDYMYSMSKSNIVIDQTGGDSLGMNALYSMALGKVVLTAHDQNLLPETSPAFDIEHNVGSIIETLEFLLSHRSEIEQMGFKSRQYVETYHDHMLIAQQYLDLWLSISAIK